MEGSLFFHPLEPNEAPPESPIIVGELSEIDAPESPEVQIAEDFPEVDLDEVDSLGLWT